MRGKWRQRKRERRRVLVKFSQYRPPGKVEGDPSTTRREVLPHLLPAPGRRITRPPQLVDDIMIM